VSRARDLANGITTLAPLASPDFTGTVDLTGTTLSLDNDQISGDKVSGGTIGAGTFNGTIGTSADFPAGAVIQAVYWRIPATTVQTDGSWSASTNPTGNLTYAVADTSITRKSTNSKMIGVATGHVDHNGATSHPSVVSLTPAGGGTAGNTIFGAGYRHTRVQNTEPIVYSFAFQDDFSAQPNSAVPTYYLRCHSTSSNMYFSRVYAGSYTSNPFTLLFWEVEI